MEDHIQPNSPFMVYPIDNGPDQQSRLTACRWADWIHIALASSPRLFTHLRQHLLQQQYRCGFSLIYCTVNLEDVVSTLQRGEQISDKMIFQVGQLCNSSVITRPDLLEAMVSDRTRLVFIVNAVRKDRPSFCYVISSRTFNFLHLVQSDKYTGFQPWKNIQIIAEKYTPLICQYCAAPAYCEYQYRCLRCGCGIFCSHHCMSVFTLQESHTRFCNKLRYLMTGYHGTIS
jgi:hypothetical protein